MLWAVDCLLCEFVFAVKYRRRKYSATIKIKVAPRVTLHTHSYVICHFNSF